MSFELAPFIRAGANVVPVDVPKKLPERTITIKGYIIEIVLVNDNDNFKKYNQQTYFVKFYLHANLLEEVKMYLKVYPERQEAFTQLMKIGILVEIPNVKQSFSKELNFVYKADFRQEIIKLFESEPCLDPRTRNSFQQRLRAAKEPMSLENLSSISTTSLVRSCLKVA